MFIRAFHRPYGQGMSENDSLQTLRPCIRRERLPRKQQARQKHVSTRRHQSNSKQKQPAQVTRTRKNTKNTRRAHRALLYGLCSKDCSIVCYDVTAPYQRKTPISARKIYVQQFTRLMETAHSQKRMGNLDCTETPQHTTAVAHS